MTESVVQRLAIALHGEGYAIKKIEDEQISSYDKPLNGEQYTGRIIIIVRPLEDEEAEAEAVRLRKEKEREIAKANVPGKPEYKGDEF